MLGGYRYGVRPVIELLWFRHSATLLPPYLLTIRRRHKRAQLNKLVKTACDLVDWNIVPKYILRRSKSSMAPS